MPTRRPLIAGNWKMNLTHLEAIQVVQKLSYALSKDDLEAVEVVVCPPFTALRSVQTVLDADRIDIRLGAQDCYHEEAGAFTGEVSPGMLAKLDVDYVICGHSERRALFGETDESVGTTVRAVSAHGMLPILCVGETLAEREAGETDAVIGRQLAAGLAGLGADAVATLVVAYEPVWAIGTGMACEPDEAERVIVLIRAGIGGGHTDDVRILYGGSVKSANIASFMRCRNIDGALVGGASLDPEEFSRIVRWR